MSIVPHIPKSSRYTLGTRIENKFLDLLEITYIAYFIEKEKKEEKIAECIFNLDLLKFLVSVSWESRSISNKHYEDIAVKLDEIGKMLWGWKKSLKQPDKKKNRA